MNSAHSTKLRMTAAIAACLAIALALAAEASASITPTSTASTLGGAMNASGGPVTGGSLIVPPSGTPNAVSTTALTGFPESGSTNFGVLTTGDPLLVDQTNTAPDSGISLGGTSLRGDTDFDASVLDLTLNVPAMSNSCLKFDFRFLSEEYPEFVGTEFNDAFIAELDTSDWSTSGSDITGTQNFAKDQLLNPITINATGPASVSAVNSAGTTYDAATQRLTAARAVSAGAHQLFLSIFDQGDHIYDSAVFVDNIRVVSDAVCATGVGAAGTPPNTAAVNGSVGSNSATFNFGSPPPGGHFVCQIHDGPASDPDKAEPFDPCTSPFVVDFNQPEAGLNAVTPKLDEGVHTLSVAAVNSDGDADQTPSTFEFNATPGGGGGGGATTPPPASPKPKKCKKKKGKKAATVAKKCKKKK
jgi:hypothetical protein